jgi:hypothetical protein
LNVGGGVQLGSLANSSVVAITSSTGAAAVYCERAPSGNDIYKLELIGGNGATQFTYRNDGGNLLQLQSPATGSVDQLPRLNVATKNGLSHAVYCYPVGNSGVAVSATGTFGSASTAFTNAGIVRSIGYDAADSTANFNGRLDFVAGWTRALSVTEIESLRANPWQIFRAPEDGFIALPAAVTVAQPQGISGSALVGSVSASASARAVPPGVAAATSVGSVSASAGTSANASPPGVGISASVGIATITAGARAAPTGIGALAQVGAATASAGTNGTAAPTGVTALTSIGAVIAAGNISLGSPTVTIDATKVSPARTVIFQGGKHTVTFEGGRRVVTF